MIHFIFKIGHYNKNMKEVSYILAAILASGILMPPVSMGGVLNSTSKVENKHPEGKLIQYIRPSKTMHKPDHKKAVTPYGDFCTRCSKYGMGQRPVNLKEALDALTYYFKTKGLSVKNVKGKGRFLKAEIYKEELLVDRVLFDRKTGRIRSIY